MTTLSCRKHWLTTLSQKTSLRSLRRVQKAAFFKLGRLFHDCTTALVQTN